MAMVVKADLPVPADDLAAGLDRLARRARAANGGLMRIVGRLGGLIENRLETLPDPVKDAIEAATGAALSRACGLAGDVASHRLAPDLGPRGHLAAVVASGAAGGAGGLASTLPELLVTVPILFGAIQRVARAEGFDPQDEAIRRECLMVFAMGLPKDARDDGINTGFLAARMMIHGTTVRGIIAMVAPRLAALLSQKLAAQAVPALGSLTGAGVNYAFARHFQAVAEVRFGLMQLGERHGVAAVEEGWRRALAVPKG